MVRSGLRDVAQAADGRFEMRQRGTISWPRRLIADAARAAGYDSSLPSCPIAGRGKPCGWPRQISLRGVEVHNLKAIDLDIPHRKLIVLCGVSGSGKSSLALDTLYAEGQRRYIESFSAYTRQFLERLEKPDAERIDGIPPAIAVTSKNTQPLEPVDRRHGHRDGRLPAAAVRQDRPRLLPAVRPARSAATRRRAPRELLAALPPGTRYMIAFPLASAGERRPRRSWPPRCRKTASCA